MDLGRHLRPGSDLGDLAICDNCGNAHFYETRARRAAEWVGKRDFTSIPHTSPSGSSATCKLLRHETVGLRSLNAKPEIPARSKQPPWLEGCDACAMYVCC
jgi:hypothetical protein